MKRETVKMMASWALALALCPEYSPERAGTGRQESVSEHGSD